MNSDFAHGGVGRQPVMLRSVFALMLREMVTTYGRSPGGYLWAIIEPVAAISVLSIVFSLAFRAPSLGGNFPLFYATAYLPFMLFMDLNMKLATSVRFSKSLLHYPVLSVVDVLVSRFVLNFVTHVLVACVVLTGIAVFFDQELSVEIYAIINAYFMAAVLAFGFGTLNCFLFMAYPITERLWQIVTRPLVIVSGLFFLLESVPGAYRDILWYNPLYHVTGEFRAGIYGIYDATYVSSFYVYMLGASFFAFGFFLLSKNFSDLINS